METIKQAEENLQFLSRNMCGSDEIPFQIVGINDEGEEFTTYQSGFNRLQCVKDFRNYHTPFTLISVMPLEKVA